MNDYIYNSPKCCLLNTFFHHLKANLLFCDIRLDCNHSVNTTLDLLSMPSSVLRFVMQKVGSKCKRWAGPRLEFNSSVRRRFTETTNVYFLKDDLRFVDNNLFTICYAYSRVQMQTVGSLDAKGVPRLEFLTAQRVGGSQKPPMF